MFKKLNIIFSEWKHRTSKLMFPDTINPICFFENKIAVILCIVALLLIEILFAFALGEISVNIKLLIIAHAVAVLISTLFWGEYGKYDFDARDIENLSIKRVVVYNFARGVNFIWLLLPMAGYVILMGFVLLFPMSYGIYLYSIHIFFIALYFYIKKNNLQLIDAMKNFADGAFSIILYVCSGFNFPYISMCGSGKIMTKFGINRR
jgi:hypothetical protein